MTTDKNNPTEETYNFKNRAEWLQALNNAPADSWIKKRSIGSKDSLFIPIAVQQALADLFFNEFDVFDEKYQLITNEIAATVKISVLPSYPNSEHRIISGSGTKPIQMDSGSSVKDFPKSKKLNALEYNLPASRSAAISNALSTFGNIFGRNVGRSVSVSFNLLSNMQKKKNKKKKEKKNEKS